MFRVFLQRLGIFSHIGGCEMVGHDFLEKIEPEQRNLCQYLSLLGDAGSEDIIESRNAIGRNKEQMFVADLVDVSNFAAGIKFQVRKIGLQ